LTCTLLAKLRGTKDERIERMIKKSVLMFVTGDISRRERWRRDKENRGLVSCGEEEEDSEGDQVMILRLDS
jgi:hypothetical protein